MKLSIAVAITFLAAMISTVLYWLIRDVWVSIVGTPQHPENDLYNPAIDADDFGEIVSEAKRQLWINGIEDRLTC